MQRSILLVCLLVLAVPITSFAEIRTYTQTIRQPFGGSQSPDDARIAAIAKAKREVLEKAGTYLESLTIVRENVLARDEIVALSAGVLRTEIVSQKNYVAGEAFGIEVVAKVDVDTSIIEQRVKKLIEDREHLRKYQESKKREDELLANLTKLEEKNRQLTHLLLSEEREKKVTVKRQTKPDSKSAQREALTRQKRKRLKEELKKEFRETSEALAAVRWNEKAVDLWNDNKFSDPDKALTYLTEAIRLDPKFPEAYNSRGALYFSLGKYHLAIEDYTQAIRLDPKYATAYTNRGVARRMLGQLDEAISDYTEAIHLDPQNALSYQNRSKAYNYAKKYREALVDANQAIRLDSNNGDSFSERGWAYMQLGKYRQAIQDYTEAIRLDPHFRSAYIANALNNRGYCYKKLGKRQEAIEDYEQALRLDPDNKTYVKNLRSATGKDFCLFP